MRRAARRVTVFTHRRAAETAEALGFLCAEAEAAGVELRFDPQETRKHGLVAAPCLATDAAVEDDVDLCLVLGGDGSILSGLRAYAGTGVPVFGVNFGEVGFLAAADRDEVEAGVRRALAGEFEVLGLPGIEVARKVVGTADAAGQVRTAMNDVSIHRKPGLRVAQLAYRVGDDEVGRVRCDGLVVATPAGSTGYNLANGGPVMAWGVEGFVVSFIAPHSLTARSLVVAPDDVLTVINLSSDEPADITVDGRPAGALPPGAALEARFAHARGSLAQTPGATFYHRLRQKFGRLASGL